MIGMSTQRATFPVVAIITETSHFSSFSITSLSADVFVSHVIIAHGTFSADSASYSSLTSSTLSDRTNDAFPDL